MKSISNYHRRLDWIKNNGIVPRYYVENSHEAIIPRDLYMRVEVEIVRRANLHSGTNRKSGYTVAGTHYRASSTVRGAERFTVCGKNVRRYWCRMPGAGCDGKASAHEEMKAFLEKQADIPAEYDKQFVRRLIERVTIFDETITVRFKSSMEIDVEK